MVGTLRCNGWQYLAENGGLFHLQCHGENGCCFCIWRSGGKNIIEFVIVVVVVGGGVDGVVTSIIAQHEFVFYHCHLS